MMYNSALVTALALLGATAVSAQRPNSTSICDYYTTALFKTNNGTTQMTLLTALVNTAVIGNYTQPNVGIKVAGILAPGVYNGTKVNLLPYFDGALLSTNDGGSAGVSQNFLDDGAAQPLMMSKPSNGNTTSNQYMLLTHLYGYFGLLLGCTAIGDAGFPAYAGDTSMYSTHKFMALDAFQLGYFIEQVGLAAASFGVAAADLEIVGNALESLFGYKCAPPVDIVPGKEMELQAICVDESCPTAPNATCAAYAAVTQPASATGSMATGSMATGSMAACSTCAPNTAMSPAAVQTGKNGAMGLVVPAAEVVIAGVLGYAAML